MFGEYRQLMSNHLLAVVVGLFLGIFTQLAVAQQSDAQAVGTYQINAGDVLQVDVWNEASLSLEQALVRPDGFISVPVIGEVEVGGSTVAVAQRKIADRLDRYMKDEPNVVVTVLSAQGSRIFVLGKVNRSGAIGLLGDMDVVQALSLAGGLNQYAAENRIKILRRDDSGKQSVFKFRYSDVRDGSNLKTNILLQSGDVVLVP